MTDSDKDAARKNEPEPFRRFAALAAQVIAVPKAAIDKREAAWKNRPTKHKPRKSGD